MSSNATTRELLRDQERLALRGELPPKNTPMTLYDFYLRGAPRWGNKMVLLRDRSDLYLQAQEPDAGVADLGHASPLILLFSLAESQAGAGAMDPTAGLADLAMRLFQAQDRWGIVRRQQQIIVTLAKVDRAGLLPQSIRDYLRSDPFADLWPREEPDISKIATATENRPAIFPFRPFASPLALDPREGPAADPFEDYLMCLQDIHFRLISWLETLEGGKTLLQLAETSGTELTFCITSALGSQPDSENRMILPWLPRRILDPLIWALEIGGNAT